MTVASSGLLTETRFILRRDNSEPQQLHSLGARPTIQSVTDPITTLATSEPLLNLG